ncbi:hypothetical protein GQ42DRAFT_159952 [Ramicandelaber brevisporus]|nr:hypothetical protein GQ42DRAFT_159952 [Ramicandelaber brevisporus]
MSTPSATVAQPARVVLPTSITPVHYALRVVPSLPESAFVGQILISLRVNEASREIRFNAVNLQFLNATLTYSVRNGEAPIEVDIDVDSIAYDEAEQVATIVVPDDGELSADTTAMLSATYLGEISSELTGFYHSEYMNSEGGVSMVAMTQFQVAGARRAFPCWDQPDIKATFELTLVVPSGLAAVSNTHPASINENVENLPDAVEIEFARTPPLSTYHIVWVIGELEYLEASTPPSQLNPDPICVRVYTTLGLKEQGRFALDVAVKAIDHYSMLLGMPFPCKTISHVAAPDLTLSGMEGFGCCTYRSIVLLVDDSTTSLLYRMKIAEVVAHETAHMFFGDLVTLEWWSSLALNESFATWAAVDCLSALFPDWDVWPVFYNDHTAEALVLDSKKSSHPVYVEIPSAMAADEIFDALSYGKGASIIRMLAAHLGRDVFFKGVSKFLRDHEWSTATDQQLWDALSTVSGVDVVRIAQDWYHTMGYPLVSVHEETDSNNQRTLVLRQRPFLANDYSASDEHACTLYYIPIELLITAKDGSKTVKKLVLDGSEMRVAFPADCPLYKVNAGGVGFYRTQYTPSQLKCLSLAIRNGSLSSASDRLGIVSDTFELARAGVMRISEYLSLLAAFESERSFAVLQCIAHNLQTLLLSFAESDQSGTDDNGTVLTALNGLAARLFGSVLDEIGWTVQDGEGTDIGLVRELAVAQTTMAGYPSALAEAHRRFQKYAAAKNTDDRNTALPAPLRQAVFSAVMKHSANNPSVTLKAWDVIYNVLTDHTQPPEMQNSALRALSYSGTPETMEKILKLSLDPGYVRSNNIITAWIGFLQSASADRRQLFWRFFCESYDDLAARFEGSAIYWAFVIEYVGNCFSSRAMASAFEDFFAEKDTSKISMKVNQAVEGISLAAACNERDYGDVLAWAKKQRSKAVKIE